MSLFISLLTEFLLFLLPAQRDRRSPQRRFFANRYRGKYKYQLDFELSWHTYNSLKMKWLHNAQSLFKNTALLLRRPTNLPLIKGQIISECPYEIIVYLKIATKKFPRFLPWPLRRGQIKNFIKPIMLNNP